MTTLIRAHGPAELIGLFPVLAGCTPRRSLVILPFRGRRSEAALRVDLPRAGVSFEEYVAHVMGLICRVPEVEAVAMALYDDAPLGRDALPWRRLVSALGERAADCELAVLAALCVGADAWADYLDDPHERHPLPEIDPSLPEGPTLGEDQYAGAALPLVDDAERARVREALTALAAVLDERLAPSCPSEERRHPQAIEAASALDDLPGFYERMLESPEPAPYDAAALAWCLEQPLLRDAALAQWAGGRREGARALGAQLGFRDPRTAERPSGLLRGEGPRPNPSRLRAALTLVRAVAARTEGSARAGALCAAAWLSWARGRSTHAAVHLAEARQLDPGHPLARRLSELVDAGTLPAWAFAPNAGPSHRP